VWVRLESTRGVLIWGLGSTVLDELASRAGAAPADDHEPGEIGLSRDALAGDYDSYRRGKAVLWLVIMSLTWDEEFLQVWLHT
jgi:hypothetical protein